MPKRNIPNLRSLKTDDLKLLKYMEEKGREIAKRYSIFKITYSIYIVGSQTVTKVSKIYNVQMYMLTKTNRGVFLLYIKFSWKSQWQKLIKSNDL